MHDAVMEWAPATKQEVLKAVEDDWITIDPVLKAHLSNHLIDPEPVLMDRIGRLERVFIVARIGQRIMFFDDVEGEFGIAKNLKGKLVDTVLCGNIVFALQELERPV